VAHNVCALCAQGLLGEPAERLPPLLLARRGRCAGPPARRKAGAQTFGRGCLPGSRMRFVAPHRQTTGPEREMAAERRSACWRAQIGAEWKPAPSSSDPSAPPPQPSEEALNAEVLSPPRAEGHCLPPTAHSGTVAGPTSECQRRAGLSMRQGGSQGVLPGHAPEAAPAEALARITPPRAPHPARPL
jgi:hypothetical protein